MRLYYMTSLRVAQIILAERRMKLSLFHELNDPFELLGVSLGEKTVRGLYKEVRKYYEENVGILCFTKDWRSPVMWAHYADKHYGVCLGFDFPEHLVEAVEYESARIQHTGDLQAPLMGLDEKKLKAMMLTKYKDWSYECEHRFFSHLEEKDSKTGFYYVDFSEDMKLAEVILGARCCESVAELSTKYSKLNNQVEFWKVRAAFTKYEMVDDRRVIHQVI